MESNNFRCEITAALHEINFETVDDSLYPTFKPSDLKTPRFELHKFRGTGRAEVQGDSATSLVVPQTIPRVHTLLKTVTGNEAFYELQMLICCPYGLKSETITANLSIQTGHGVVSLKEGIKMELIIRRPKDLDVSCCFRSNGPKHNHYVTRLFPLCPIDGILNHVWLEKQPYGDDLDRIFTGAYAKLIVTGSLPFTGSESSGASVNGHFSHMKTMLEDAVNSDVKLNGIPCHQFMLISQSDVFRQMLEADMMERNSADIHVPESTKAVMALLRFLYYCDTWSLSFQSDTVITEVICLGHRLNMPTLVQAAVNNLLERPDGEAGLDSDLILELFDFAEKASLGALESTLVYILKRRQQEDSGLIQRLISLHPETAARLLAKVFRPYCV